MGEAYISIQHSVGGVAEGDICKLQNWRRQFPHVCESESHDMVSLDFLCQTPSDHFVQSLLLALCLSGQLSTAMAKSGYVLLHVGDLILLPSELFHLCILKLCSCPHICIIIACNQVSTAVCVMHVL